MAARGPSEGCVSAVDHERFTGSSRSWSPPGLVAFAADSGSLPVLRGENVGEVLAMGVAPAQIGPLSARQRPMAQMIRGAHRESAQRPEPGHRAGAGLLQVCKKVRPDGRI